ncbi:hypothetical protein [Streptomyces sp. WAC05374]|uniref:hypothetical protein n=1 Tax=Streptomyces sp. WAC05374 TaxID=2487420 RepID=UPI00135C6DA5
MIPCSTRGGRRCLGKAFATLPEQHNPVAHGGHLVEIVEDGTDGDAALARQVAHEVEEFNLVALRRDRPSARPPRRSPERDGHRATPR